VVSALRLLSLVLIVGCGSPSVGDDDGAGIGDACSLTEPCSTGGVCDFTADGGPICITADGDLDGDGLTNDKDFCQHQMGGQYDEDGDGVGDDCDRCPIAPPRATPDSDNDMVDAPCDPAPTEDGDVILLFDGFAKPGLDTRWKPTTATAWTAPGGEAVAKLDAVSAQEYLATTVVGKNSMSIEASFRVDKVETTASEHLVGVFANDPRPAGVAQMQCYVTKADTDQVERVVITTNSGQMGQITSGAFESANLYRAGGRVSGTSAGCSVLSNGNPLGAVQANITADQLASVALTARAASVRFQYVIVTGR
jgi:hypothetical protein